MEYPFLLTTSDWVDFLDTLTTRDEKITALASYHRRIEHESRHDELDNVLHPSADEKSAKLVAEAVAASRERLAARYSAHDYSPSGEMIGRVGAGTR